MLTGLRDRLERELSNAAPHTARVKVTTPSNALERRFSTWIGECHHSQNLLLSIIKLSVLANLGIYCMQLLYSLVKVTLHHEACFVKPLLQVMPGMCRWLYTGVSWIFPADVALKS